jgi:putative ABC transport system substrate-binding protein
VKKATFIVCLLVGGLLFIVPFARGQTKKVFRVGYLSAQDRATESPRADGIRLALRELGYTEGQNLFIEYRYTQRDADRASQGCGRVGCSQGRCHRRRRGDRWIQAAVNATQTIPIVMTGSGLDPVAAGHVKSLALPGGNVTGITNLYTELGGKRLELLKDAVGKLTRVAVVYQPGIPSNVAEVKEVQSAARTLGLTVRPLEMRAAEDFRKAESTLNKERMDGLYVAQGPLLNTSRKQIVALALNSRLPSIHHRREFVESGGLMSYGVDTVDSYRHAAVYIDKILKGAKPADLPVEQPTKFELVINLKTAKQIGLTIPPNVLARADRVIK